MRRNWTEAFIEWIPSVVDGLVRRYGGGVNRVAERMDVSRSVAFNLGKPEGSNPTLKTIKKFVDVFNKPVIVFPSKWDNKRKEEWLKKAHGDCITSIIGD